MPEREKNPLSTTYSEIPALLLRTLVHGVHDPVKIVDRNYRVVWLNCWIESRIEEAVDHVIGKFCYEVHETRQALLRLPGQCCVQIW